MSGEPGARARSRPGQENVTARGPSGIPPYASAPIALLETLQSQDLVATPSNM
jgi:hypothetical protein